MGVHIIEMLVHNAHYLYKEYSGKRIGVAEFKQEVIEWLIGELASPKELQPVAAFHHHSG